MTFSILAHDPDTGELGGAAATGNLAVGGWVLKSQSQVGVIASQGYSTSTLWSEMALNELSKGTRPQTIVENLVKNDAGHDYRQIIILDSKGQTAGWTGCKNQQIRGHTVSQSLAIAGNWLENEKVLATLEEVYRHSSGPLANRLLTALEAAVVAGSDSRGTLSAALKVVAPDKPPLDLRIDLSDTPVADLISLHERTKNGEYTEFLSRVPTNAEPEKC